MNFYYDGTNCYWNIGQGYGTAATVASTNLASSVSGTLAVANGGTGATTLTGIVKGNGTGTMTVAVSGTDYVIPGGNITGTASNVTGTVALANGGTGATTLTGYVKGNGTSAMTASSTIPVSDVSGAAPLASPALTGTPTAPTAAANTNTTQVATTAFVTSALSTSGLPSQSGNNGKFLTTNGSSASWATGVSGSGTLNYIPRFSSSSALSNSSLSDDGTGLRIGNPNGTGGIYTGLSSYDNTRLMVSGGREYESIRMTFPGDPYNNELSFNWYGSAWRMRTERSSGEITDLSFWKTTGAGVTTEKMRIDDSGYVKATGFKTQSGTSSQFLKANGTVDNSTYLSGTVAVANGGTGATTKATAFDALSPMTTSGDIIYGGANGTGTRLSKGSNGSILTMENDLPTWNTSIKATPGSSYNAPVGFSFIGGDWARNTGMFSDNPDAGASATLKFRIATSNSTANSYLEINPSKVSVLPTTASTSKTTGALTVAGGLGVDGNIYTNNLNASGTVTAGSVTYPNTHNSIAGQVLTTNATGIASWASAALPSKLEGTGFTGGLLVGHQTTGDITGAGAFQNTGVGIGALQAVSNSAIANSATGYESLQSLTSGQFNTAMGYRALKNVTTSLDNTAFGSQSLMMNTGTANTAIGNLSLQTNTTGNNNTAIGASADVSSVNLTNATAIGFNAKVATSNTVQLGNTNVSNVQTSGTVTAGSVTYPNAHGTANQVLSTTGSGTLAWVTPVSSAASLTGTLAVANGGTGLSTTPANGQIDIGNGTGFTRATITAGTAITITNTAGAITISAAVRPTTDQASATAAQTSFTLSQTPLNAKVWMFINGVRTNNLAYSVSGTTLTYVPASNNSYVLVAGDRIQFDYAY